MMSMFFLPPVIPILGKIAACLVVIMLIHGHTIHFLKAMASTATLENEETSSLDANRISAPPVFVVVSTEALCPDCKDYINDELIPTFEILGDQVMDVRVIPFGNSRIDVENQNLECQHGFAECDANAYEQCAADIYPYASRYLPFIQCVDNSVPMGYSDEPFDPAIFAECARFSALDWSAVSNCHGNADRSWDLQVQASEDTPSDHTYVPWLQIDGEHADESISLLSLVCGAYQGSHPACDEIRISKK